MRDICAERWLPAGPCRADVTGVALTTQLVCWRPKGRRYRAGQRCFARGQENWDRPAAVCRNDRRLGSRQALVSTTVSRSTHWCEPESSIPPAVPTRRARRPIARGGAWPCLPHGDRTAASAGGEPPVDRSDSTTQPVRRQPFTAGRPRASRTRVPLKATTGRTSRSVLEATATLRRDTCRPWPRSVWTRCR